MKRRAVLAGAMGLMAGALPLRAGPDVPSAARLAETVPPVALDGLAMADGEGAPVRLGDFAGEIIVVNLWAPWCLPCRREMPSLARLAEAGTARVLPLCFDWRGAAGVRRFYRETGVETLPVLIGDGDNLHATLSVEILPTSLVIDRAGRMVARVVGEAAWDDGETRAWLEGLSG